MINSILVASVVDKVQNKQCAETAEFGLERSYLNVYSVFKKSKKGDSFYTPSKKATKEVDFSLWPIWSDGIKRMGRGGGRM